MSKLRVWKFGLQTDQNLTDNARNIVAIQDIGESDPANIGLTVTPLWVFKIMQLELSLTTKTTILTHLVLIIRQTSRCLQMPLGM